MFRGQLLKQRRTVGRSPANMSHETSSQLLARLHCMDAIGMLLTQTQTRVHLCARAVAHLETPAVQQWWNLLILLRLKFLKSARFQAFKTFQLCEIPLILLHPYPCPTTTPNPLISNINCNVLLHLKYLEIGDISIISIVSNIKCTPRIEKFKIIESNHISFNNFKHCKHQMHPAI